MAASPPLGPTTPSHLSRNGLLQQSRQRSSTPNGLQRRNTLSVRPNLDGELHEDPRIAVFRELYLKNEARLASLFSKEPVSIEPERPVKRKAREIDEDDYGDEEEEDDDNALSVRATSVSPTKKSTEEVRQQLEQERKTVEDAARRTFHTLFYTLENDRDAMLEQKKLEESERKVEAELGPSKVHQHGILSQTNLGASSLTLKNLIRRIDSQRDKVRASDTELRTLMSEVRKNRSKWASEDKVGQEELYEACDKVLSELKGQTEHSTHFLNKVNKKDAPDYHLVIKHPMDLGTMTKKLKNYSYRSKKEFVDDAMLVWANCLKYNANPEHYMRKHALFMRKETDKLVPLIPDIVIRERAEVEAEERRQQQIFEADDESDDEPILSSRGRKAPAKKTKKQTPEPPKESTPEIKPEEPPGTPGLVESTEIEVESTIEPSEETYYEDAEYKTWKQMTKKDRAIITAERHRLFLGNKLDPEATALTRTRAGMRNWLRRQQDEPEVAEASLAEGLEDEEARVLPDYYDLLSAIPDMTLREEGTSEGQFLQQSSPATFQTPSSGLTRRIDTNIQQILKTRQLAAKIGVVKQMSMQFQLYQGQFQKKDPVRLVEQEMQPIVVSDGGPLVAPRVSRAALTRASAKLLVHAGFETFQPSAMEAITDIAGDYLSKLAQNLAHFHCAPNVSLGPGQWRTRFTTEECILHSLQECGLDLDALNGYVHDELERASSKLTSTHDRMKAHFADLLRPALSNAGPDGAGAFDDDSEQFLTGDFAEELGEDFLGLKELGLGSLFGDWSMNVPLHLMQKKLYHAQASVDTETTEAVQMPTPPPFDPISMQNVNAQIGLVRNFFLAKLHANEDNPLVEDEDLPAKQRLPKPRLGTTGKITSPRKKMIKEPGPGKGHSRKKFKPAEPSEATKAAELAANSVTVINGLSGDPVKPALLFNDSNAGTTPGSLPSPESLQA